MDKHDPAYDSGGAYWGTGMPLYELFHDEGSAYVRAIGPQDAIERGKAMWPGANFVSEKRCRNRVRRDINGLKSDIRSLHGPELCRYDVMGWLFDICAMMYRRGIQYPAYEPRCENPECNLEEWLAGYSTEALYRVADILDIYADVLEKREEEI